MIDPRPHTGESLTPGPSSQNPRPCSSSLGPTSSLGIYSSWCTPGASALTYCLRDMQCKSGGGTGVSFPRDSVKKSDMKMLSYLYCRSTLKTQRGSRDRDGARGADLGRHRCIPTALCPPPERDRARWPQMGMKTALAVPGTRQLS